MILIVDSGSTKCDWIAVDNQGNRLLEKIRTKGLNPAILSESELLSNIKESDVLIKHANQVQHVFFYGAGCGTQKPRKILLDVLQSIFKIAKIEVQEDTMAAVRATIDNNNQAAVVCIMGTGSNCSYFDGNSLHQKVISLGYVLMDDASGNYFGKQLIRDYYFNKMPEPIKIAFENRYNLDADYIKYNLYKQPNPNAYLANFAEFMFLNKDSVYMKNLIQEGVELFTNNMIMQFKEEIASGVPVHFAGSIAFYAQDQILKVADKYGFKAGNFVRRPIEGLVDYHINTL